LSPLYEKIKCGGIAVASYKSETLVEDDALAHQTVEDLEVGLGQFRKISATGQSGGIL
jgi:hypothetical protein